MVEQPLKKLNAVKKKKKATLENIHLRKRKQ